MTDSDPTRTRSSIKSFVLRTGRMTAAQLRALEDLWPKFGLEPQGEPFDLDAVFGRKAPRTVEIGFGDGRVTVDKVDVSEAIRTPEITSATRPVANAPLVRAAMKRVQRRMAHALDVVAENRAADERWAAEQAKETR